jgi:hypothetical protein
MENPGIDFFVAAFEFGDVAVTNEDGFSKLSLGKFEGFSKLVNPFIGGHGISIAKRSSQSKIIFYKMSIDKYSLSVIYYQ